MGDRATCIELLEAASIQYDAYIGRYRAVNETIRIHDIGGCVCRKRWRWLVVPPVNRSGRSRKPLSAGDGSWQLCSVSRLMNSKGLGQKGAIVDVAGGASMGEVLDLFYSIRRERKFCALQARNFIIEDHPPRALGAHFGTTINLSHSVKLCVNTQRSAGRQRTALRRISAVPPGVARRSALRGTGI